jgi:predicted transcriptional regulator
VSTFTTTVRMDQELADRIEILATVIGESKNTVLVSALKMFVNEYESDPSYQQQRSSWVAKMTEGSSPHDVESNDSGPEAHGKTS